MDCRAGSWPEVRARGPIVTEASGHEGGPLKMDRLWAPWRASYIRESSSSGETDPGCFLCRGLAGRDDRDNLLAWRREHSVVVLNRYPYNNGPPLVAPIGNLGTLGALPAPDRLEPIETFRHVVSVLDRMLRP